METTRICKRCGVNKDISEFIRRGKKPSKICNTCERKYNSEQFKKWYKGNPDKVRIKAKQTHNQLRIDVLNKLGNSYVTCGFSDFRALQIDHVNGHGNEERKQLTNKGAFYRKVLKYSSGAYQLLCANCNWIKRHENKEIYTKPADADCVIGE